MDVLEAQMADFEAQLQAALLNWLITGDPIESWYAIYRPHHVQCKVVKGLIPRGWALIDQERVSPYHTVPSATAYYMGIVRNLPILKPYVQGRIVCRADGMTPTL